MFVVQWNIFKRTVQSTKLQVSLYCLSAPGPVCQLLCVSFHISAEGKLVHAAVQENKPTG